MAELILGNPFESFSRGQRQGAQNALIRRQMDFQKKRPELIRNALTTGETDELFAQAPALGAEVQSYLGQLSEQERAGVQAKHEQSSRLLAFVQAQPPERRAAAYQQVVPRINAIWGKEVMDPQYNPTRVGMALAQAREVDDILGQGSSLPADLATFEAMTEGLPPEEVERARRIQLGLSPRASSAAVKTVTFKGADGRERLFLVDADGTIIGPANEKMVSPTEQQSAHDTALGSGRGRNQAEREANAPKLKRRAEQQIAAIDNTFVAIDKALEEVDWTTAGPIGSAAASVPGTDAYNLRQTVLTIKANIGFDRLQQMREASPTGGALGQVSNQEIDALQATIASLDLAQTPAQLRANLKKVREHYERWKDTINKWKAGSTGKEEQAASAVRRYNPETGKIE